MHKCKLTTLSRQLWRSPLPPFSEWEKECVSAQRHSHLIKTHSALGLVQLWSHKRANKTQTCMWCAAVVHQVYLVQQKRPVAPPSCRCPSCRSSWGATQCTRCKQAHRNSSLIHSPTVKQLSANTQATQPSQSFF